MRRSVFVLIFLVALPVWSKDPAKLIVGRWRADINASLATLRENAEYQKSDRETRSQIEAAIASDLAQSSLEITAATIEGADGKANYKVASVKGNLVTLSVDDGTQTSIEIVDANTIRLLPPPDLPMSIVMHRDTTPKPLEMGTRAPASTERDAWLKHVGGKWRIDRITPMVEQQRASEAFKRATPEQRKQSEEFWKSLSEGPAEYFVFSADTIQQTRDGGVAPTATPLKYKLLSLSATAATIQVSEDDGFSLAWTLTERSDGSIRVSGGGSDLFDLYRVK